MRRKIYFAVIAFITLFSSDIFLSALIYHQFFFINPWIELGLYCLLIAPIFLFKSNIFSLVYSLIIELLPMFFAFLNTMMYEFTSDIFSLDYLFLVGIAGNVANSSYWPWRSMLFYIPLLALTITATILVIKFTPVKNGDDNSKKEFHPSIVSGGLATLFLLLNSISLSTISSNPLETLNKQVYTARRDFLGNYGLMSYFIYDFSAKLGLSVKDIDDNFNKYNEYDEYHGSLEGYNVITIMVETGVEYVINETLTPNIWTLKQDGISLVNNKSKNKTNASELIGITGVGLGQSEIINKDFYDDYSIVSYLNDLGYTTSYFHDNSEKFFNRKNEMTNLGFQNIYMSEEYDPDAIEGNYKWNGSYALDSHFTDIVLDYMVPVQDDPFYTFFTTYSMHGPYYNKAGSNYKKFHDLGYYKKLNQAEADGSWANICNDDDEEIQNQIEFLTCAAMDTDAAIGKIINRLKETNQYDNTIICIYGDHDAYYKSNGYEVLSNYVYDSVDEYYPERYSTMNIISNPNLKTKYNEINNTNESKIEYTDFTSPYVIVPTLLDLLGIDYNPDRYFGTSIFNTQTKYDNLFYSHEFGIYFNSDFTALSQDNIKYTNSDSKEDLNLFNKILEKSIEKVYTLSNLLLNDGFRKEN